MNEGTNQPAPMVHNGVMFINNPGQHRPGAGREDGRADLGEPHWSDGRGGSQRGLAIYNDKVYVTTGDAHIYALDARTGKNVWDTVIGDRTTGAITAPAAVPS